MAMDQSQNLDADRLSGENEFQDEKLGNRQNGFGPIGASITENRYVKSHLPTAFSNPPIRLDLGGIEASSKTTGWKRTQISNGEPRNIEILSRKPSLAASLQSLFHLDMG